MQHEYVLGGDPPGGLTERLPEFSMEECGTEECKLYMLVN